MCRLGFRIALFVAVLRGGDACGNTIALSAVADSTLNQHSPNNNMGAHTRILAGESGQPDARRGLLRFDVAGNGAIPIPAGSLITSASLSLNVLSAPQVGSTFDLFRSLVAWNEGSGTGNLGSAANAGESTWNARLYASTNPTLWGAAGGLAGTDYASASSGATAVGTSAGTYSWTGSGLVADVQSWLDSPASNFGWFLISEAESTAFTAAQIGSREAGAGQTPTLTIQFTPVPEPPTFALLTGGLLGLFLLRRRYATVSTARGQVGHDCGGLHCPLSNLKSQI